MLFLSVIAMVFVTIGHLWFSWELWANDELLLAVLLLLVPIPLIGLFAWYRSGWDANYRMPAAVYFGGYVLAILTGVA